ncbi:hypothetical protein Leryth_025376, partial [Lithospermum erythrorhizon]
MGETSPSLTDFCSSGLEMPTEGTLNTRGSLGTGGSLSSRGSLARLWRSDSLADQHSWAFGRKSCFSLDEP